MTQRRSFLAYLLLMVSIVMLSASLLPHHHHWGEFCVSMCEVDDAQHRHCHQIPTHADHNHSENRCCSGCVANFCFPQPPSGNGMTDVMSAFLFPYSDYSIIGIFFVVQGCVSSSFYYGEWLPKLFVGRGLSLRAPPFFEC